MTRITSREQLLAELKPGARLELADGDYGALEISRLADVAIEGGPGAVFAALALSQAEAVTLRGVTVDWNPTDAKATVARIAACKRVSLAGLTMRGRVVSDLAPGALSAQADPPPPMNSFLVGYYAGRALAVEFSEDVAIEGCDVSGFFQGVSVGKSSRVRIEGNHIHRLRTTPIKGGGTDVVILGNLLEHMTPYRYLDPATGKDAGDHFDFVHMYSGDGAPIAGLVIAGNLLDAAGGADAIGIFLQAKDGAPITGPVVSGNVILTGRNEGVALTAGVVDAIVADNLALGPPGSEKPPTLVTRGATLARVTGNDMAESAVKPRHAETFPDNTWRPRTAASAEEIADARAAWLAKHRPVDPRDARIAELEAQLTEALDRLGRVRAALA